MAADDTEEWWISCSAFTCWVKTKGTIIVDAAPIAKKWIGQNFFRFCSYYNAEKEPLKNGKEKFDWIISGLDWDKFTDWELEFTQSCEERMKEKGDLTEKMENILEKLFEKKSR